MSKHFVLIDGSNFIFRAFFAIRSLSTSSGIPTNAVMGFAKMIQKLLRQEKPSHVAVVLDTKQPTFRHEIFPQYKANRDEPPEDLIPQFDLIRRLIDAFNWKRIEMPGFEADDIIGTLADRAAEDGFEVAIVSSDKDLLQLLGPHVRVLDTMKDKWTGHEDLVERFGGGPERVVDVLALAGDKSDNVPGVPGVGEKTAVKLLNEYGSLEVVLENAEKIKGKLGEKVAANKDQALLSKRLVSIKRDIDLNMSLDEFRVAEPNWDALTELLTALEMARLLADIKADPAARIPECDIRRDGYELILDEKKLDELVKELEAAGEISLDLETTSKSPMSARIVGLSFCCDDEKAYYIPVAHEYLGAPKQITLERALEKLKSVLENDKIRKIGQNIKYDWIVLRNHGADIKGVAFDTMIGDYLLNPESGGHNLDAMALRWLNHQNIAYSEVAGKGKQARNFAQVTVESAKDYAAEDAHVTRAIYKILKPMIVEKKLDDLMNNIEIPLVEVLVEMERTGVFIDRDHFAVLSREAGQKLGEIETKIYDEAGAEFNLNSPAQVSEILFDKLNLPKGKKTKTGYSTDVTVLEKLASKHPVPKMLLEYRAFHKLKSTYIDALPQVLHPETGRLHTSYNQAVTATGRLSSSDPNLQNIPIRSAEGRRIREGFTAPPGCVLLSADYSQVELRILAHLARDEAMIRAFQSDADIHSATASQVFGVLPGMVSPEMRRQAKAVNFGIIYGMSAFRLGRDLEIGVKKAQEFIDTYFARFSGVKKFIEATIQEAREKGYVTTLMGRRRAIPELQSSDRNLQGFGERSAVNTPIQGTAADIIKIAMIRLHERIEKEKLPMAMILQVHDELVFEIAEDAVEAMKPVIADAMEGVIALDAPLKIDVGVGPNWAEAH